MTDRKLPLYLICLLVVGLGWTSCNEEDFLREEPIDFFSPGNSFSTFEQFNASLADLYAHVRQTHYSTSNDSYIHHFGTDMMKDARLSGSTGRLGDYSAINPASGVVNYHWARWFKVVSSANVVLDQLTQSELSADEQTQVTAEARYFRGWAYRYLYYLFGEVPVYTEAINSPRTDFVRASEQEVIDQIISDLSFAAENLGGVDEVADGRVNALVARHYLAETQLTNGEVDAAITNLTAIIDDPATALMTERFGTRVGDFPEADVYFDLFRRGNQNRSGGNTEALWVAQMENNLPGGLLSSTGGISANRFERFHAPASWTLNDPDDVPGMLSWVGDLNAGGRGVSFLQPTFWFEDEIFVDENDLRNSEWNFVRDVFYNNPESAFFGQSALDNPGTVIQSSDWRFYPWLSKVTTPENHPAELYSDPSIFLLNANAGATYADQYYLRLAETYLLRAEAHLANGNADAAAENINTIRNRVSATPVSPGDVDLDYILDERARELSLEEQRRITLHRTGTLVDRVRRLNTHNADDIQDFHARWPIPLREIEANTTGSLVQNPGY